MTTNRRLQIAPDFLLDLGNERLSRGSQPYPLRPKTFAVLKHLVTHPGRVVTKAELLDDVWSDSYPSDMVLKVSIRELRKALDDDPKSPRFIETAHGRGYRFIGSVTGCAPLEASALVGSALCGRDGERQRLHDRLARALAGERQVVFVLGEPGAGKTALIEGFLAESAAEANMGILHGRCQTFFGAEHPFLPVLDSLEHLARSESDGLLKSQLGHHAPSWLARLPSLLEPEVPWPPVLSGVPHLGELMLALDRYADDRPLIQILEDVDRADPGTLDLVLGLGERRETSRHLLIATCPPPEQCPDRVYARIHRRLSIQGRLRDLRLDGLDVTAVQKILRRRLAGWKEDGGGSLTELATKLRDLTEGNPLYLECLVEKLLEDGELAFEEGTWYLGRRARLVLPPRISDLVEERLVELSASDRRLLEAASVLGPKVTAPKLAAALGEAAFDIGTRLEILARRGLFLRRHGGEAFHFRHALERRALAARLTSAQHTRYRHFAKPVRRPSDPTEAGSAHNDL